MALWWLYGGYIFPVVVKPENLTFEGQGQLLPLTNVFCTSGPNLVVLAWKGDELSHRQAQNGVNFEFEVIFDFEDQSRSPQNNKDLKQGLLHLWSEFGDPS